MTRPSSKRPLILILAIIVLGITLDQFTKALALDRLTPGVPVPIVSDIFQLSLLRNPGAAFGTGTSLTLVFSILALLVVIAVAVFIIPKVHSRLWAVAVGLGMAGVTGNFIDRLIRPPKPFQGHVIDFFALKYFAVFNVADIFLTAAAILIVVIALFVRIDLSGSREVVEQVEEE